MTTPSIPQTAPVYQMRQAFAARVNDAHGWEPPASPDECCSLESQLFIEFKAGWMAAITAQPQAVAVPAILEGWKLVPIEPTPEMLDSVGTILGSYPAKLVWQRMSQSVPRPPACQQDSSNSEKQAGLYLKDARPPAGQQDRGEVLKRATELQEKASMPWGQALELAMREHGISLPLYQAINKLVCQIGYEGSIDSDHALVTEVMDALHDLDGGTNITAAPQAAGQQEKFLVVTEQPHHPNVQSWPERIWLQGNPDDDEPIPYAADSGDDTTWCADRISGSDIEYLRSDLVAITNSNAI